MARKGKKRLTVDLPEPIFELLVEMSKKLNVSMTSYIMIALDDRFKKESDWDKKKYV